MQFLQNFLIIFYLCSIKSSWSLWTKCTSDDNCQCYTNPMDNSLEIHCENVAVFPNFENFSSPFNIFSVSVSGDFSEIPSGALFPLGNLNQSILFFTRENFSSVPLIIHDTSFDTVSDGFFTIEFFNIYLPISSTQALTSLPIASLEIENANLLTLQDNTFSGLTITTSLELLYDNITSIQSKAFNGLTGSPRLYLWFNSITQLNISNLFTQFSAVYLDNNNISYIGPFAFSCQQISQCPNVSIETISLTYNQIINLDVQAFGNLPNLHELFLSYAGLQTFPVLPLRSVASSVNFLFLDNNNITTIPSNALNGFRIYQMQLDFNPIKQIYPGAFNGLWIYQGNLALSNLNELSSIDILVTYGMVNVVSLQLVSCQNLTTLDLEDASKLPPSLSSLSFSDGVNIQNVSPNLAEWLDRSFDNAIDLSNNDNFNCTRNIAWMAKYAVCNPTQIYTNNAYCAQHPKLPVYDYLLSMLPKCD